MKTKYETILVMGKSGAGKQPRINVLVEEFGLKQLSTGDIFRTYLRCFNALDYTDDLKPFYNESDGRFLEESEIKERLGISNENNADDMVLGLKAKYFIDQGKFVPDSLTNSLFESAFLDMDYGPAVLDGYPRTIEQTSFLWELAKRRDIPLDAILLVDNDDELIKARCVGRRICPNCGEVYHLEHKPPRNNRYCTVESCSGETIQRSDDTLEKIQSRLQEFHTKVRPAMEFLKARGIPIYTVSGNLPEFTPETVKASVFKSMHLS